MDSAMVAAAGRGTKLVWIHRFHDRRKTDCTWLRPN